MNEVEIIVNALAVALAIRLVKKAERVIISIKKKLSTIPRRCKVCGCEEANHNEFREGHNINSPAFWSCYTHDQIRCIDKLPQESRERIQKAKDQRFKRGPNEQYENILRKESTRWIKLPWQKLIMDKK